MILSVVLVLTPMLAPMVISSWPAIAAAVAGAALAMGLTVTKTAKEEVRAAEAAAEVNETAEVEVAQGEILANVATEEEIVLTRGAIEIRVKRDARGRCAVCVSGRGHTKAELKAMAEEFTNKMTQCFVYNRVMTELKAKGFQVVNEERTKDETIAIHVRRWEG